MKPMRSRKNPAAAPPITHFITKRIRLGKCSVVQLNSALPGSIEKITPIIDLDVECSTSSPSAEREKTASRDTQHDSDSSCKSYIY